MGANDPTKPNQALNGPEDQPADFTKVDIDDLFDRLLTAKEKPTKTSKASAAEPIAIAGYGRIERMTMPEGWKEVEGEDRSLWQFSVEGRPEVAICLPAGFRPLSEEVAERVSAVLSKPAHVLTPTELKSLNELLMERGEPQKFKMVVARTVELNARKVIVVEGRFAESQQDNYVIYVDKDGSGRQIQQIYYMAPKDDYPRHLADAKESFKSIQWG